MCLIVLLCDGINRVRSSSVTSANVFAVCSLWSSLLAFMRFGVFHFTDVRSPTVQSSVIYQLHHGRSIVVIYQLLVDNGQHFTMDCHVCLCVCVCVSVCHTERRCWWWRRDDWSWQAAITSYLCHVCHLHLKDRGLELHHISYSHWFGLKITVLVSRLVLNILVSVLLLVSKYAGLFLLSDFAAFSFGLLAR